MEKIKLTFVKFQFEILVAIIISVAIIGFKVFKK